MTPMPLIFAATCDLAGKLRGKAFPADQLEKRKTSGVGWTPTNVPINCFDEIGDSPFGALGDLLFIPDPATELAVNFGEGSSEHFMLGNITSLEGEPWDSCTRSLLQSALDRLHDVAEIRLVAVFEHEFQLRGDPVIRHQAYGREGFELQRNLCETLMAALQQAGMEPDSIMKEYGPTNTKSSLTPISACGLRTLLSYCANSPVPPPGLWARKQPLPLSAM